MTSRLSILRPNLLALALATALPALHAAPDTAPATPDDTLVPFTVTTRDTLIGLNRKVFTVPDAWRDVARINHLPDSNRINPGQVLMVPARYLRSQVVPARLLSGFGDVRIADKPAAAGAALNVGDTIRTGESSTAVIQLADGSRIRLAPGTEGRLDEQRRFRVKATSAAVDDGLVAASLRLISGSIEVFASKVLRLRPLEVSTPTAVIGVRGTIYRVRNDVTPATAAASAVDVSATEVLEGKVHAQVGSGAAQAVDVPANFGAQLEAGKKPVALPLPPAPDLGAVPALFDHLPIRFALAGGNGAARAGGQRRLVRSHRARSAPGRRRRRAHRATGRRPVAPAGASHQCRGPRRAGRPARFPAACASRVAVPARAARQRQTPGGRHHAALDAQPRGRQLRRGGGARRAVRQPSGATSTSSRSRSSSTRSTPTSAPPTASTGGAW